VTPYELVLLPVTQAEHVARVRQRSRAAAMLLGLDVGDQTRVATAVSEAARAVFLAGGRATVSLSVVPVDPGGAELRVRFDGERGGPAAPLPAGGDARAAAGRLMDGFREDGRGFAMTKQLPPDVRPDAGLLASVRDRLGEQEPTSLLTALQEQNDELAAALVALRDRETELLLLNTELEETNRGVVALYAELEQRSEDVRKAQRAVFEELEDALRPPPPAVPGVELGVRYLPAQRNAPTGGDLYDWLSLPDGSLHAAVVDVLGHGVASTRDALLVTHAVRTLTLEGHRLGRILERTDALLQAPGEDVMATVLLVRLDPGSGLLQLAGGGHPPALLLPAQGPATYVEAPGRPVGYPEAGSDDVAEVALSPGDIVLLYTDGLVELRRDILEGMESLRSAAEAARGLEMEEFLDAVLSGVRRGDPLGDDTLLLALRWAPGPGSAAGRSGSGAAGAGAEDGQVASVRHECVPGPQAGEERVGEPCVELAHRAAAAADQVRVLAVGRQLVGLAGGAEVRVPDDPALGQGLQRAVHGGQREPCHPALDDGVQLLRCAVAELGERVQDQLARGSGAQPAPAQQRLPGPAVHAGLSPRRPPRFTLAGPSPPGMRTVRI